MVIYPLKYHQRLMTTSNLMIHYLKGKCSRNAIHYLKRLVWLCDSESFKEDLSPSSLVCSCRRVIKDYGLNML